MDIATLIGLFSGAALIIGAISFGGGDMGGFLDIPSVLVVIGGTLAVTLVMFPMKTVLGAAKVTMKAFFAKTTDPQIIVDQMIDLANIGRREGLIALEKKQIDDPFIKKGVMLVADGNEENVVASVMDNEIESMRKRHRQGQSVFKGLGMMSPAFGMIGTLIGLVKMLQNLSDPSSIGPAMAVALLTTFYGAVLANLVFLPIAKKLEERSDEETQLMEISQEGVLAVLRGEHPTVVKDKLSAFLAPNAREES